MSASAATFGLQPFRPLQSCMLDHLEDMPILNMIFGQFSTAAPSPKPLVKRRAKESPARDEEDETSDCPMEQVVDENPSASQQPKNVNMEQVDYDRDTDNDDDLDDEEQPLAGNPMPKAMPHPKLVPKSPPPTLRPMSKIKPAPENILDEETESDNNPGDRPALPRRPAMRPTLTSNDRWHAPDGSDTDICLQRESVHPGPVGNSRFLNFVRIHKECSTILKMNPDFHFIPEHERQHGVKVFWLRARFNDYWQPTLQGEGQHTEKQYMDFIKKVHRDRCKDRCWDECWDPGSEIACSQSWHRPRTGPGTWDQSWTGPVPGPRTSPRTAVLLLGPVLDWSWPGPLSGLVRAGPGIESWRERWYRIPLQTGATSKPVPSNVAVSGLAPVFQDRTQVPVTPCDRLRGTDGLVSRTSSM